MLLANGKLIQSLRDGEKISVLNCMSDERVLVVGNSEERYAMINLILDSIKADFPEDQVRDEDDPRYILRSIERDGIFYPNYEKDALMCADEKLLFEA